MGSRLRSAVCSPWSSGPGTSCHQMSAAKARETAHTAAAMALAPIAWLVPGEARLLTVDPSLIQLSGMDAILGAKLPEYARGYAAAKFLRLQPDILGGSVRITTTGNGPL